MAKEQNGKELSPALIKVWEDLVQKVENNPGIWSKPWFIDPATKKAMRPYNPLTKRNYSGFNQFHLEFTRLARGYGFNQWLTFNQAKKLGGFVNKGEKGTPIIVFNPPEYQTIKDEKGEEKKEQIRSPFFSYAIVFNISQTNVKPEDMPVLPQKNYTVNEVEEIISKTGAWITHTYQDRAFYNPAMDIISLPEQSQFKTQEDYYETKFHELVHWTGHESRLNRLTKCAGFGSKEYSREELVAEIGAVFLKAETGITNNTDNATAYIKNWWQNIKEDKGSLITAAGQAQKSIKFILGGVPS